MFFACSGLLEKVVIENWRSRLLSYGRHPFVQGLPCISSTSSATAKWIKFLVETSLLQSKFDIVFIQLRAEIRNITILYCFEYFSWFSGLNSIFYVSSHISSIFKNISFIYFCFGYWWHFVSSLSKFGRPLLAWKFWNFGRSDWIVYIFLMDFSLFQL